VSAERRGDTATLEQTFVRVTAQKDFAPVAREILDVMQRP